VGDVRPLRTTARCEADDAVVGQRIRAAADVASVTVGTVGQRADAPGGVYRHRSEQPRPAVGEQPSEPRTASEVDDVRDPLDTPHRSTRSIAAARLFRRE
jgi:hypothetical protein